MYHKIQLCFKCDVHYTHLHVVNGLNDPKVLFLGIDNFDRYFPSKCENIIKLIHMHVMFTKNLKEKMNSANNDKFS